MAEERVVDLSRTALSGCQTARKNRNGRTWYRGNPDRTSWL